MKTSKSFFLFLLVFLPSFLFSQEIINLDLPLKEKKLPFGLTKKVSLNKPKISLVLSGGGSRALSHLGVLKILNELNIQVDQIIGTSMGSVIGGLYSAGYSLPQLENLIRSINWDQLFFVTGEDRTDLFVDQKITEDKSLFTIRLNGLTPVVPQSINTGKKISNLLTSVTMNAPINKFDTFDELLFNYRAVSTELVTGDRVVLSNGSLSEAMRASSSVSFLLPPIKMDSLLLVDGGLIDNLPIKTAIELNPDFIIASDATSSLREREDLIYPWDIADQLVTIPSRKVWEENKQLADILVTHDLNGQKNNDFKNIDDIILAGYNGAKKKFASLKKNIEQKYLEKVSKEDRIINDLKLSNNPNDVELEIYSKVNSSDYIKKSSLLIELNRLFETGDYENISAKIIIDTVSILSIEYQLNPKINSIKLEGVSLIPLNTAYGVIGDVLDKPYNSDRVLNSVLELVRFYRAKDYMLASPEKISFNKENGELLIEINEGKVSDILVSGNKNTHHSIIKRELSSLQDNFLTKKSFDEGLRNLSATDLFDNIIINVANDSADQKKLNLHLDEKLPRVLRFGLRIDDENFTQFAVDLRNENLFGSGSELGLSIAGGTRNMSYVLEHKTNRIFNTYLTYKAQAFYKFNDVNIYADDAEEEKDRFSRSRVSEYRQRFYGGFVGIGAHLRRLGTLTTELKYEVNEIEEIFSFPKESEYDLEISSWKFRLQIDSQNKYPYPTSGVHLNTFYETAQKIFGGDVSFAKFSFDYSGYFTFSNSHTIKPRLIFGFADETLPLSQHFDFGGQSNFLGYRDFEFRGRQIFITSLQYRYLLPVSLYFDTYLKIRYDLGSSWLEQEQIHFDDLKHGIGLTISLDTPIGPADFSIGRSLYIKDTSPERIISRGPFMFYFTIGYYY